VGIPGKVIKTNGKRVDQDLEQDKRDPVIEEINLLKEKIKELEKKLEGK
jgi:hypothetical protein